MRSLATVVLLASACFLVAASIVVADEKELPEYNGPAPFGLTATFNGSLASTDPIWNRTQSSTPPGAQCTKPSVDSGFDGQFYDVICVRVTDQNPITIEVDGNNSFLLPDADSFLHLYCAPFNPATPAANLVFSDDDDGLGFYSAFVLTDNIVLTPGNYDLVVSSFAAGETGDYQINTSTNVVVCPLAVDAQPWGTVKSLYR